MNQVDYKYFKKSKIMPKIKKKKWLKRIKKLTSHMSFALFGQKLYSYVSRDKKWGKRVYMQMFYTSPCTKTSEIKEWRGRKWYLTPYMTESEVVFTAWAAFEAAVKHETMEGFRFDNQTVINPHVNFRKLLEISPNEVQRKQNIIPNFDV